MHRTAFSLALALACGTASAAPAFTAGLGTTGLNMGLAFPVSQSVGLRVELSGASFGRDFATERIDYDGELRLRSVSALLDVHPFGGAFRLTGGAVFGDSGLTAVGRPSGGVIRVGGLTVPAPAGEQLEAELKLRSAAPYLGIGFGQATHQPGWGLWADLGVTLAEPRISLRATPMVAAAAGQAALDEERGKLQSQADKFKLFPVLKVGLRYGF